MIIVEGGKFGTLFKSNWAAAFRFKYEGSTYVKRALSVNFVRSVLEHIERKNKPYPK